MSKAKDRARAESGLIFRNGKLWRKEDWYALHPTKEMLAERQAQVDRAVAEEMASSYYCSKCGRRHKAGSKIYEAHQEFKKD